MTDRIECGIHGERQPAVVCIHLVGNPAGLGFNRSEPTTAEPFPEAWCDDCELIRKAHGGWTDESEKLVTFSALCAGCYERALIRNTRTSVSFDDLATLRWKCGSCEEWHTGPCLDFAYDAPAYWSEKNEEENRRSSLLPSWIRKRPRTFLDSDYCMIDGEHFFVRGLIRLPIIGTAEFFGWGVWGSLSQENFEKLRALGSDPKRVELPPLFSWMSSGIPEYPETLNLKMTAHIQKPPQRPHFELEATDHPLSQEFHHGISAERVKEIMMGRLRGDSS